MKVTLPIGSDVLCELAFAFCEYALISLKKIPFICSLLSRFPSLKSTALAQATRMCYEVMFQMVYTTTLMIPLALWCH